MLEPNGLLRVAIVGSLLPAKGVYEFFDAAVRLLKRRDDLVFIYVGRGIRTMSAPVAAIYQLLKLTDNTETNLQKLISRAEFKSRILMLGHRDDLVNIYSNVDVLCFPSHYNAPGRPIFEAGYFGKPSIVAIDNPMTDTLVDGVTGIAIKGRDSRALEDAIEWMVENPEKRLIMGQRARELTYRNFDLENNVQILLGVYKDCLHL
jgi:glycosyltransferase involved in cell wall biosynthesis